MLLVGGSTVHAPTFFLKAGRPLEAKKISQNANFCDHSDKETKATIGFHSNKSMTRINHSNKSIHIDSLTICLRQEKHR
jgi:hypothetical protein